MADTLLQGYYSLASDANKVKQETDQGQISDLLPELSLDMDDDELIELKRDWIKQWTPYEKEIRKLQDENEEYWLGKHFKQGDGKRPLVDNLIFEALETFLPIATRPSVEPIVEADNTPEGNAIAYKVQKMLAYVADIIAYKLTLKQVARYWALYLLGVIKVGWSMQENDITCAAIRPQKLVLDPKATVENCEYNGRYIGEYIDDDTASDLVVRFPQKKAYITDKVKGKMGTTVQYIMWTTNDYIFWTLEDEVLAKNKNPHWNYDTQQQPQMDQFGQVGPPQTIPGKNHFKNRKKPYVFLSYFNLGKQPHDDTNLIQQNLPLQDSINKRLVQMDKNADNANGGLALSGDAFTEEQAGKAAKAKRAGGVIWVPTGPVQNAVVNLQGEQLPQFVYQSLIDYRNELRNIFGIRGSSPQGTMNEKTVAGKIITKNQDTDRIGGGVSPVLEEFSDAVLNWFVQLMYVYYDEPHVATVLGKEKAQEYISLSNQELGVKLLVGVKEGSMIPKDPVSERQEAYALWAQKGIDPITFFERLDFPNPRESAKNLYLWLSDPIALFPDLQMAQQQQMQQQQAAQAGQQQQMQQQQIQAQQQAQAQQQQAAQQQAEQKQFHTVQKQVAQHQLQGASGREAQQNKLQQIQLAAQVRQPLAAR